MIQKFEDFKLNSNSAFKLDEATIALIKENEGDDAQAVMEMTEELGSLIGAATGASAVGAYYITSLIKGYKEQKAKNNTKASDLDILKSVWGNLLNKTDKAHS